MDMLNITLQLFAPVASGNNAQQSAEGEKRGLERANEPIEEEEGAPSHSQRSESLALIPAGPGVKGHTEKRKYASAAASKPATAPERPWTQVSYKNRKPNPQRPAKS